METPDVESAASRLCDLILSEFLLGPCDIAEIAGGTDQDGAVHFRRGGEWLPIVTLPVPALHAVLERLRLLADAGTRTAGSTDATAAIVVNGTPHLVIISPLPAAQGFGVRLTRAGGAGGSPRPADGPEAG